MHTHTHTHTQQVHLLTSKEPCGGAGAGRHISDLARAFIDTARPDLNCKEPRISIKMRRPRMLLLGLLGVVTAAAAAAAARAATPPVEQVGNALVPAPDSLSAAAPSVTVRVDFARPFKPGAAPLVVATPYFRRLDSRRSPGDGGGGEVDDEPPLLFAASALGVETTGFELHVERLDERLPWRDAMVLVSWIGACGQPASERACDGIESDRIECLVHFQLLIDSIACTHTHTCSLGPRGLIQIGGRGREPGRPSTRPARAGRRLYRYAFHVIHKRVVKQSVM